jgi:Domain of unknown function (DUF4864)
MGRGFLAAVVLALTFGLGGCATSDDPDRRAEPPPTSPSGTEAGPAPIAPSPVPTATPLQGRAPRTVEPTEFLAEAERDSIRRTISAQIEAFRRDDARAAFALAAPVIQEMFGTPEHFLEMVRIAYAPLYRPRDVRFAETTMVAGEVTQKVVVIDAEGRPVMALYLMDRRPDGAWRILGCVLIPSEETIV